MLDSVTLAYLPQNSPPVVKSINVVTQSVAASQTARPAASSPSAAYSVTVSDTGDVTSSAPAGTPTQTLPRAASQQITVAWQAEDPDGDRLVYNVYFRGEDETQWKLLRGDTHDNSVTFDADVLADGKYFFRVVASDREANPPATAREGQLVSAPVMIDNTPPVVTIGVVRHSGGAAHIEFEAADAASRLAPLRVLSGRRKLGARGGRRWRHRFAAREIRARPHRPGARRAPAGDPRRRQRQQHRRDQGDSQMMEAANRLARILGSVPPRLCNISESDAAGARGSAPGRWSKKEILGHLIDSAGNNHQRFVRAQFVPSLEFPGYEQEELGGRSGLRHRTLAGPGESLAPVEPPPGAHHRGDAGIQFRARVRDRRQGARRAILPDRRLPEHTSSTTWTRFSLLACEPCGAGS